MPERELEAGLGLEEVLRRRIREFIEVFGEDSEVLPSEVAPQEREMVRAYSGEALADESEDDDDLDGLSRHQERLLRFRKEEPEEYAKILRLRPGRFSQANDANAVVASRVGSFWYFWQHSQEQTREINSRAALDHFFSNTTKQATERANDRGWSRLADVEAHFLERARTLQAQQAAPRMSPSILALLESLEKLDRLDQKAQRELVDETVEWVRSRAGHPTVERMAYQLRRNKSPPEEAFAQCRKLFGTVSAAHDELGEAILVAASLPLD